MEVNGHLYVSSHFIPRQTGPRTLSKRTVGPQGSRGYFGEKKNLLPVRNQTMIPHSSSTYPCHCTNCAYNFISTLKRKVVVRNRIYVVHISRGLVTWKMRVKPNRWHETAMMGITEEDYRALNSMTKITFLCKISCFSFCRTSKM